nr:MAG TPA: hypothetical protein [Caudoviricetes sp.]
MSCLPQVANAIFKQLGKRKIRHHLAVWNLHSLLSFLGWLVGISCRFFCPRGSV